MRYQPQQASLFLEEVKKVVESPLPPDAKLWEVWLTLLFIRKSSIAHDLKHLLNGLVYSGPFKGIRLTPEVMNGNNTAHMLGCYEHELHDTFERVISAGYRKILNIGCSFGYYSVGLALRMPQAAVEAFDIDDDARERCRGMIDLNNVTDRVTVSGEFRGEDFAKYSGMKTLALVDIEGAERDLLDPARYPALRHIDLIVELHDVIDPSISNLILDRFRDSHDCEIVGNKPLLFPLEEIFGSNAVIDPFDSLIATWETRDGFTPWAVMRAKRV